MQLSNIKIPHPYLWHLNLVKKKIKTSIQNFYNKHITFLQYLGNIIHYLKVFGLIIAEKFKTFTVVWLLNRTYS